MPLPTTPSPTAGELHSWSHLTRQIVSDVWHKYGPFAALLMILLGVFIGASYWLVTKLLEAKDDEIERLVTERNRLQEVILKDRRTTGKK